MSFGRTKCIKLEMVLKLKRATKCNVVDQEMVNDKIWSVSVTTEIIDRISLSPEMFINVSSILVIAEFTTSNNKCYNTTQLSNLVSL